MPPPTATFCCPACAATVTVAIRRSVIPQDDAVARDRILAGLGWVYRCEECGVDALVDHDLLYYDRDRRFMIYYAKDFETPANLPPVNRHAATPGEAYCLRLAFHREDLREKVRLFEAYSPDDRIWELVIAHFFLTDRSKQMPVDARVYEHGKATWQTDPKFVFRCVRPDGSESFAKYSIERWHRATLRYRPLIDAFTRRYATDVNGWLVIDSIWARTCVRAWQSGDCR